MSRAAISRVQSQVAGVRSQSATERSAFDWSVPGGFQFLVDGLGICECRRRLLHMLPGLLPTALWFIPHRDPWGFPLVMATLAITCGIASVAMIRELDFTRRNEIQWNEAVTGYCLPVLISLFLLPGRSEIGLMTLGILAFGDGSATLGGKLLKGPPLPWNGNKTWTGLCCFLLAGTTVAAFNFWIEASPHVDYSVAFGVAAVATLVAAIAESLPLRSHDNLRVGTTAALAGLGMHLLVLGW